MSLANQKCRCGHGYTTHSGDGRGHLGGKCNHSDFWGLGPFCKCVEFKLRGNRVIDVVAFFFDRRKYDGEWRK